MSVPAGSRVALVGPSGVGKSSLGNLLLRFWAPEGGEPTLGGISMNHLAQDTSRRMMGWVAQDAHLFNTTIRENIALGRPEALDAEITEVARVARLGPWIDSLPDGLDTHVGEQGARLSGGQRQRLAVRAQSAEPSVLILDEPTSGLDEPRLVHDVLVTATDTSLLYVTHRLDELTAFD